MREFHARPAVVVAKEPFIPVPSTRALTEISDFQLNTEKRSEERHQFDMFLKQKEDMIMAEKRRVSLDFNLLLQLENFFPLNYEILLPKIGSYRLPTHRRDALRKDMIMAEKRRVSVKIILIHYYTWKKLFPIKF